MKLEKSKQNFSKKKKTIKKNLKINILFCLLLACKQPFLNLFFFIFEKKNN